MIIIKKYLLLIAFVFISLLAVGAVSAVDGDNLINDQIIQASEADNGDLDMEPADDEEQNSIDNSDNPADILSDSQKDTPDVNVEDVTVIEGENVTIPFKVTDSNGNIIGGEVNVTISGENNTISKNIRINNESDQFKTADLIEIIKANNNQNISDIYDILTSSTGSTGTNISEIITGFAGVYNGLGLNLTTFIDGIENLINGSDADISVLMEGLQEILININISMLTDGLDDLINWDNINFTNLVRIFSAVMDGFDLNFKDIYSAFSLNIPLLWEGINSLNDEFNFSQGKNIIGIIKDLNLKYSLNIMLKALYLIYKTDTNPSEIADLFNEFLDYNNLTFLGFLEKVGGNVFAFNFTDFIYKIANSDFDKDTVINAVNNIIKSVSINYTILNSIIENINDSGFNSSKVIGELTNITGINSSQYLNTSNILSGLYKIIAAFQLNGSNIDNALNKILSAFKFNIPNTVTGLNKIYSSFNFNSTMVMNGLDRIAAGFGINISAAVGKIITKYGYFVTFSDTFAPGVYNVSVKYLSNDNFNSAISNTAKLTVLNKKDSSIIVEATVDGYDVVINGSINSNATGFIVLIINNETGVIVQLKNGIFTYKSSFTPGEYNITVLYPGHGEFNKNSTGISFTVKSPTKIIASQVYTTYGTGRNLIVTLRDADGNAVADKKLIIKLNGKQYSLLTSVKGQVSVAVANTLTPKTYTASVTFEGDDKYIKTTGTVKVVVSKAKPKITAKKKTFKIKTKTKKYAIVLKTDKGKVMAKVKVTFKVKGKTYRATTNKKGKATFKITKLNKKGSYNAKIMFAGNAYYKSVSKKVKIIIKK